MKFSWLNPKPEVEMGSIAAFCKTCGVAFKPRTDAYSHLCWEHAKDRLDADRSHERFLDRCTLYRHKIEPLLAEWQNEDGAANQAACANYANNAQNCYPQGAYSMDNPLNQQAQAAGFISPFLR